MRSYAHLPTRLCRDRVSSLQLLADLDQAAGDTARNRPRGQLERFADRAIGLVTGEEAVEDLPAVLGQARHRVVDVEGFVDPRDRVFVRVRRQLALLGCLLARARAQPVDAGAAGQLRDPGLDRLVVAERVEPLVGLGKDFLEDVFGVVFSETKTLYRDRVHVAREAGDELCGRDRLGQGVAPRSRSAAAPTRGAAWPSPGGASRRSLRSSRPGAGTPTR